MGEGKNFVRTMAALAEKGVNPSVVDDQVGRLTFTQDLAAGIDHLIRTRPAPGTYNLSCTGDPVSWSQIAADVFELTGQERARVTPVSTNEYYAAQGKAEGDGTVAPRPRRSVLDLVKLEATGFTPRDGREALEAYLRG